MATQTFQKHYMFSVFDLQVRITSQHLLKLHISVGRCILVDKINTMAELRLSVAAAAYSFGLLSQECDLMKRITIPDMKHTEQA